MWFPVFVVDFPFSILLLFVGQLFPFVSPLVIFGIGGTLWWYFVSLVLALVFKKVSIFLHSRAVGRRSQS